jgi:hypothetical protein
MFSLLLTHGRQIVAARLNDLRHREPFVRLPPLGTLPGASQPSRPRSHALLIGEFLPLLMNSSLEG